MANNFLKLKGHTSTNVSDITDTTAGSDSIRNIANSKTNMLHFSNNDATGDTYASFKAQTSKLARQLTLHYDFATDGGAIGTINLRGGQLPDNAIINNAWYEVTTTFTSATDAATIALGVATDDATGIEGATAISAMGNIWDAGVHDTDVDSSTASTYTTKTTAARNLVMTLAVEAVTAGALVLHIDYSVSELDTSDL